MGGAGCFWYILCSLLRNMRISCAFSLGAVLDIRSGVWFCLPFRGAVKPATSRSVNGARYAKKQNVCVTGHDSAANMDGFVLRRFQTMPVPRAAEIRRREGRGRPAAVLVVWRMYRKTCTSLQNKKHRARYLNVDAGQESCRESSNNVM